MTILNTQWLFLAADRHLGTVWVRWGLAPWQGAIWGSGAPWAVTWFAYDGDAYIQLGPVTFHLTDVETPPPGKRLG